MVYRGYQWLKMEPLVRTATTCLIKMESQPLQVSLALTAQMARTKVINGTAERPMSILKPATQLHLRQSSIISTPPSWGRLILISSTFTGHRAELWTFLILIPVHLKKESHRLARPRHKSKRQMTVLFQII